VARTFGLPWHEIRATPDIIVQKWFWYIQMFRQWRNEKISDQIPKPDEAILARLKAELKKMEEDLPEMVEKGIFTEKELKASIDKKRKEIDEANPKADPYSIIAAYLHVLAELEI
jgi:hypothetical protein